MDPILTGIAAMICLLALSALGVPVGIALGGCLRMRYFFQDQGRRKL